MKEELRKASAAVFEAKRARIDLEAENSELRRREQQDREKIRHLLELTQPITEQVTFVRDCRPGSRASFPVPAPRTYAYPSTMHIASERMREPNRRRNSSSSSFGGLGDAENQQQNYAAPFVGRETKPSVRVVPGSKVLRTVYMPNEQTGELSATVESLRKQLEQHQQLAEAKTRVWVYYVVVRVHDVMSLTISMHEQHLVDQFAEEKTALLRHQKELEQKLEDLEKRAEKNQRVLNQTTKDFLILRHQSQQQEREAHEEMHAMSKQIDVFKQERDEVKQQVEREREELQEVAREEGNQTALTFRAQAVSRERDLHILKEQYAAVQEACTARIQDLQARLTKLRGRYRSLDRRRAMEMEGFSRDIASLKRHLQKLEVIHYGRRLTAQEREALRLGTLICISINSRLTWLTDAFFVP